jgi:hypothetical protein
VHNGPVEEIRLLVFADGAVVGQHAGITARPQGFSSVAASGDEVEACLARSFADDYAATDTGQVSYLVTATLRCLGLGLRPGRSVALLRVDGTGQASVVLHQADDDGPVPADARDTAVVTGWPGRAWAGDLHLLEAPEDAPRSQWPVNTALRAIGVERGGHLDEATALGLDLPGPAGTGTVRPW